MSYPPTLTNILSQHPGRSGLNLEFLDCLEFNVEHEFQHGEKPAFGPYSWPILPLPSSCQLRGRCKGFRQMREDALALMSNTHTHTPQPRGAHTGGGVVGAWGGWIPGRSPCRSWKWAQGHWGRTFQGSGTPSTVYQWVLAPDGHIPSPRTPRTMERDVTGKSKSSYKVKTQARGLSCLV